MGFRECWSHSQSQANLAEKNAFFASDGLRKKQFWPSGHEGRLVGKGFLALWKTYKENSHFCVYIMEREDVMPGPAAAIF